MLPNSGSYRELKIAQAPHYVHFQSCDDIKTKLTQSKASIILTPSPTDYL